MRPLAWILLTGAAISIASILHPLHALAITAALWLGTAAVLQVQAVREERRKVPEWVN